MAESKTPKSGGSGVQSVERVFELLELVTDAGGGVTMRRRLTCGSRRTWISRQGEH